MGRILVERTMTDNAPHILIADDNPANVELLSAILTEHGYQVYYAYQGRDALDMAQRLQPDLILLDVTMPGMDGYEVCRTLKSDPIFSDTPVIFISAGDNLQQKLNAFQAGGVDYISKPFQTREVLARIQTHLELHYRRLEVERLRQSEVAHLNKINQMKDDVLKMVSHDLKNPLGRIMGGMELLSLELDDSLSSDAPYRESIMEKVEMIRAASQKMRQMLDDMLRLARSESKEIQTFKPIALSKYLADILKEFDMAAHVKNITLKLDTVHDALTVYISPDVFAHAVQNLLANAIKYTPEGGQVTLGATSDGREISIYVKDTGLGIPPEDIPRLFDKFFRVQRSEHVRNSGVGLGLSIVKAIVDQHQGRVDIQSTLGQGSTFAILMPLPNVN